MRRRTGYNPKRRIAPAADWPQTSRQTLADKVKYGGNPEHKMRPNDYGLMPPRNPRPRKTLCDAIQPFPKNLAARLLRQGVERGMVSVRCSNGWPQNIWAVSERVAYEAQLENREAGTYHGYPLTSDDDFIKTVFLEWDQRG